MSGSENIVSPGLLDRLLPRAHGRLARRFSQRCRARRFERFEMLAAGAPRPLRIVDVGGKAAFWEAAGWTGRADVHITLVNLTADPARHANVTSIVADATDLRGFPDSSFDIAFSNSVIEHLATLERQHAMAGEMRRIAPACWVQTPNFWFPIEPHFYVPTFQWWPIAWRAALLRRTRCGCRGRVPDADRARALVEEVRLLRRRELQSLFPEATIVAERVAGMVKSWIVLHGFDADPWPAREVTRCAA